MLTLGLLFVILPIGSTGCLESKFGALISQNYLILDFQSVLVRNVFMEIAVSSFEQFVVFKGAFKEGSSYFLDACNSEAEVVKSTRPENISCGLLGQGKPIVCSAYNLDVTFIIKHMVEWRV